MDFFYILHRFQAIIAKYLFRNHESKIALPFDEKSISNISEFKDSNPKMIEF